MLRSLAKKSRGAWKSLATTTQQRPIVSVNRCALDVNSSSFRLLRLQSTTSAARVSEVRHVVPPNLKIDPRSSFAPVHPVMVEPRLPRDDDNEKELAVSPRVTKKTASELSRLQDDESLADDESEYEEEYEDDDLPLFLAAPEIRYAVPLPERLNVTVHSLFASTPSTASGTIYLDEAVFGRDPIRIDLMKRTVDYYRAKKRGMRKAVTKTISQVSGSGRKMRQQKGTGKARMGHSRPAHHRGGAKAHGPKNVTDYGNTKLNKKVRKQALSHALSQKLLEGNLVLINSLFELPTHKTKDFARLLQPWGIGGRHGTTALILDCYHADKQVDAAVTATPPPVSFKGVPANVVVASSNMHNVTVGNDHQGSVYDILKHEKLVLTLAALQKLEARLKDI